MLGLELTFCPYLVVLASRDITKTSSAHLYLLLVLLSIWSIVGHQRCKRQKNCKHFKMTLLDPARPNMAGIWTSRLVLVLLSTK
jgi:hypothetical protein